MPRSIGCVFTKSRSTSRVRREEARQHSTSASKVQELEEWPSKMGAGRRFGVLLQHRIGVRRRASLYVEWRCTLARKSSILMARQQSTRHQKPHEKTSSTTPSPRYPSSAKHDQEHKIHHSLSKHNHRPSKPHPMANPQRPAPPAH